MSTPVRLAQEREGLDRLVKLFTPFVMKAVTAELDARLSEGVTLEQLDAWIEFVEESDIGRIKKALALRILRKKRKQASEGKKVTLSKRERAYLLEKAEEYLPERVVRCWAHAVTASGAPKNLSSLDGAMLPPGAKLTLYKKQFSVFGVSPDAIRGVLREIRSTTARMPEEVIDFLSTLGFKNDLS